MAGDVFRFVDSIAASPTVRLDMNDGVTWLLSGPSVDFSPPPLRRAINGTLLTDGSVQSASSYDNRLLRFTLEVASASTDSTATQMQLLNQELDRDSNYVMWQPSGATSPVFFRTLRTPVTQVQAISPLNTSDTVRVEVLAEPFALGLREDVAVGTFNNDPAAGSNGLFFDVSSTKGDVAAPIVLKDATALRGFGIIGCRQHGTPSDLPFFGQCESMTLGTDTTNPGGGPDGAMSGTGTNNFVRTSFATSTAVRLTWTIASTTAQRLAMRGTYRIYACVRRSDSSSDISISPVPLHGGNPTLTVVVPKTTARQLVELGLDSWGTGLSTPGRYGAEALTPSVNLVLSATRSSGSGTLDWDFLLLVPADEQLLLWDAGGDLVNGGFIDGYNECISSLDAAGNLFDGSTGVGDPFASASGGFPMVLPNRVNRFVMAYATSPKTFTGLQHSKTKTGSLTVSYWPRYLYARPATT